MCEAKVQLHGQCAVSPIPLGRAAVLALLVADVLDSAEDRKDLAARAAVLGAELTGEALAVPEAPVDDQPSEPLAVDGPPYGVQIGRVSPSSAAVTHQLRS